MMKTVFQYSRLKTKLLPKRAPSPSPLVLSFHSFHVDDEEGNLFGNEDLTQPISDDGFYFAPLY
jgi:hypothetical protein